MSFHPQYPSFSMDWELGNRKKIFRQLQASKQSTEPIPVSLIESSLCLDGRQADFRPPYGCEAWLCSPGLSSGC